MPQRCSTLPFTHAGGRGGSIYTKNYLQIYEYVILLIIIGICISGLICYKIKTVITITSKSISFEEPLNHKKSFSLDEITKIEKIPYGEIGTALSVVTINGDKYSFRGAYSGKQYKEIINLATLRGTLP